MSIEDAEPVNMKVKLNKALSSACLALFPYLDEVYCSSSFGERTAGRQKAEKG